MPVLVGGADLPSPEALPEDLRELGERQAASLRNESWNRDVDALLRSLRGEPAAKARPRRNLVLGAVLLTIAVLAGVVAWRAGGTGPGAANGHPACPVTTGPEWTELALTDDRAGEGTDEGVKVMIRVRTARWRPVDSGRWQIVMATEMSHDARADFHHGSWQYDYLVVGRRESEVSCFDATPAFVKPGLAEVGHVGFETKCAPMGSMQLKLIMGARLIDLTPTTASSGC